MVSRTLILLSSVLFSLPALSSAFTWSFNAPPQQCGNLSITISGSGQPPYRVLILPFGPSPLPNNTEVRKIIDQPFPSNTATEVTWQLNYPANSQLVAVVSDQSGFGSGGTSVAAQVLPSNDASCFDASTNVSPQFVFNIEPPNQIVQCSPTRIWWDKSTVQGNAAFLGVIPGGQSFTVPLSTLSDIPSQGTGFTWTPSVRAGTTLFVVGGDSRGAGSAGSVLFTVSAGTTQNNTCLNDQSPSSTPAKPAGGSYPTNSAEASTGGYGNGTGNGQTGSNNPSSNNTGAIVGGVIGGLVFLIALALVLLFLHRRKRLSTHQNEKPVDLIHVDDDDEPPRNGATPNELPQYYQPEPFLVPDPTLRNSSPANDNSNNSRTSEGRPVSGVTTTSRSGTPDLLGMGVTGSTTSGGRKGGMRPLRPVNIIQHDDAGPSGPPEAVEEEAETVELPPAYTNLRK